MLYLSLITALILTSQAFAKPVHIVALSDLNGSVGSLNYSTSVTRGMELIRDKKA